MKDSKRKRSLVYKDYKPKFEPQPASTTEGEFDRVYGTKYLKVPIGFFFNGVTCPGTETARVMERGAAILLAFLASWRRFCKGQLAEHHEQFDGWFYCTAKTIQRRINYTPDAQQKLLAKLHAYGLIGMEMRGRAPRHRRYICVNVELLMKLTKFNPGMTAKTAGTRPPKRRSYDRQNGGT